MKKIVLFLSILVITALAVLVFSVPAQAQDKDRWEDKINETWDAEDICDFTLTVHQEGTVKLTFYVEDEGIAHFRAVDTNYRQELYAMDHPEKVVNLHFQGPQGWDDLIPEGTVWIQWIKGQWQHVTIPGYGVVYGRAGQEAIYVDCSDPESDCTVEWIKDVGLNHFDEEGIQTICDYLEP